MVFMIATLKRYFVSGVLVVVPVILTYIVLRFLFESLDGLLQPIIGELFGYFIPGLGVIITLLIIILAGVLTRNVIGAWLYRRGDRLLAQLPIIRPIYSSAKQLLEAITTPSLGSFQEVGLIEYPRRGIYALVLISKRHQLEIDGQTRQYATCFVPSTPTPISGMVVIVPADEVRLLDLTVEEAIKFLVSGGVASPTLLKSSRKLSEKPGSKVIHETR